jgi:uncharacterized protein (DUF58 family)
MISRRAWGVLALDLVCIGLALAGRDPIFASLSYILSGLLVLAFLWSRVSLAGISLIRQPRTHLGQVGLPFEESFLLRNAGRWPKVWLEIEDGSDFPGHRVSTVLTGFGSMRERRWPVRTICRRRGRFHLGPTSLVGGDPFGLFPARKEFPQRQHVVILPMTLPLASFAVPSGRRAGGEALRQRTHHVTPNAAGVREYAPGDDFHRIHWRSTARRGRLIVKEFELDPMADAWLVLDAHREAHWTLPEPAFPTMRSHYLPEAPALAPSSLEYAVTAAASIGQHLLARGQAVGLMTFDGQRQVIQPDRGAAQLHRVLEALAVVEGIGAIDLEDLMMVELPQIPRGAAAVVVTASPDERVLAAARHLDRRGVPPVLVLLDAASFGGPPGSAGLADAARRHGYPVRLVRCGDPLAAGLAGDAPASFRFAA